MAKLDAKAVCAALFACESEKDVEAILVSHPEFADPKNWYPLDKRETNFNVTSNQASTGGKALTELMTNMVDAVLMKHAYLKHIDPRGSAAPRTMYEAVDRLVYNLHGGRLVKADEDWLRDFAQKNLILAVTGAKTKKEGLPCFTFVDNGEGQHPDNFETTFLSLSAGNKKDISFVQGKYNMGSSGVLSYCGLRWFKLIVSRRYDGKSPWGWTLMRRRPSGGMPIAEYFKMPDGSIPRFDADMIYPLQKADGKKYDGVHIGSGTIIKLYDYQVGSKYIGFRGSREALNENLIETILPFRILTFGQKPDPKRGGERAAGVDPRPFYGMEFLLLRAHKEKGDVEDEEDAVGLHGEKKLAVNSVSDPELGEIIITAIPLKRNIPTWLKTSKYRVFHAVNGQVQYKDTRGYLSQTCGFPALKDRVVIIVDASGLSFGAHNDVWKGDREHVRNTIVGERYLEKVTIAIKESEALEKLQEQVAKEELDRAAKSERNDLFQKLVDADSNLAALLSNRNPEIRLPSSGGINGGSSGKGEFEGKYSPTFLRLEERYHAKGLALPMNRSRPVAARTDAENGYLQRAENTGRLLIEDRIRERFGIRAQLLDGRLTVYFEPVEDRVSVGETFTFKIGLQDDAMPDPVEDELTITITDEEKETKKPSKKAEPKAGNGGTDRPGEGEDTPTHGLPKYILLTRDGREINGSSTEAWPESFGEHDGGIVEDLGNSEVVYKINYDNAYHVKYRLQQRSDVARDVVTEKYILGMRILMLGFEHAYRNLKNGSGENGIGEFADEFRRMAARGAAATVLALAENLPKIVDASSVSQDVE